MQKNNTPYYESLIQRNESNTRIQTNSSVQKPKVTERTADTVEIPARINDQPKRPFNILRVHEVINAGRELWNNYIIKKYFSLLSERIIGNYLMWCRNTIACVFIVFTRDLVVMFEKRWYVNLNFVFRNMSIEHRLWWETLHATHFPRVSICFSMFSSKRTMQIDSTWGGLRII